MPLTLPEGKTKKTKPKKVAEKMGDRLSISASPRGFLRCQDSRARERARKRASQWMYEDRPEQQLKANLGDIARAMACNLRKADKIEYRLFGSAIIPYRKSLGIQG